MATWRKRVREERYGSDAVPGGVLGEPSRHAPRRNSPLSPSESAAARRVPISAEGNLLAAAGEDGHVRVFSFEDGRDGLCSLEFKAGTRPALGIAFLGGGFVAGVFGNGKVRTWLVETGEEIACVQLDGGCTAVAKVDDGTFVVGKIGGVLVFVSHLGGRDLHILCQLSADTHDISSICVHGETIVSSSQRVKVGVWDGMKYSQVAVLSGSDGDVIVCTAVCKRFVGVVSRSSTNIYGIAEEYALVYKQEFGRRTPDRWVAFFGDDLVLVSSLSVSLGELILRFGRLSSVGFHRVDRCCKLVPIGRHFSLAFTADGRIVYVGLGGARAVGITPSNHVAAAVKAHAELLYAPEPFPLASEDHESQLAMKQKQKLQRHDHVNRKASSQGLAEEALIGQTPAEEEPGRRVIVKTEPGSDVVSPFVILENFDQAHSHGIPLPASLKRVKQEPRSELHAGRQRPAEVCCVDLENGIGNDLANLNTLCNQPALLEAMSVDAICDVLAGVMINFEESFRDHLPLVSGCLRRILVQNLIAADSIVNFPEAKLFSIIQSSFRNDEAYGKLSQNVADIFEWRLHRFLHQLRL